MVDRVGNGPGYGYPQVNEKKVNTNAAGTGEKFQLDYGKEGAIYEPSSEGLKKQQAEKKTSSHITDPAKAEGEGVRLTLSSSALNNTEETKNGSTTQAGGILDAVAGIVTKIFNAIKGIFGSIWNDASAENGENTENISEKITIDEVVIDEATIDEVETVKAVQIDMEEAKTKPKTQFEKVKAEAEAFLASAEGKKVARNSDLLTYYDKHGTVISVSPSDRQRILYGDKNQIEV